MFRPARTIILTLVIMIFAVSCVFAAASEINWDDSYITVTGYGAQPTVSANAGQACAMARRAAIVDGYRQMAELVNGVQVDAETTVSMLAVQSDIVKTKVNGVIRNARVVEEHQINGGYVVTMTVPLFGISGSVASSVFEPAAKESFPVPSFGRTSAPSNVPIDHGATAAEPRGAAAFNIQQEGIYTGVIVDCRGLGLKPAMSPVIKNANHESIYGYKNLDYDYVVSHGMAGYAHEISQATRAGSHPLLVKAQQMIGQGVNPVLSMENADKLLLENQATHFLDKTNVVFLY